MMFETNNKVKNVGRAQFTKLVLDVFQLLTFEKLHYAIAIIIEQMPSQKGIASIEGNYKCLCIMRANGLLYNQPFSLVQRFLTLAICNRMIMYPKMNCCS
jgi:hypothetical protein